MRHHSDTSERIHAVLDGELPPRALGPNDRREAERLGRAVDEALLSVRDAPAPDVSRAVMRRIARADADRATESRIERLLRAVERAVEWLWTPRRLRLRPAWVLAGTLLLSLGLGAVAVDRPGPDGAVAVRASGAGSPDEPVQWIQFHLEAPEASSVRLAGSFSDWEPRHGLTETAPGHWSVLVPLRPGVHEYAFVLDGDRWIADPHAPQVADGFGGTNSRIGVVPPAGNGRSS